MKRLGWGGGAMMILLTACGSNAAVTPTATTSTAPSPSATAVSTIAVPSTAAQPATSPSAPFTPVTASSAPSSPAPVQSSPPPVSQPAGPAQSTTLNLTNTDEGKTFHVKTGATINVTLRADSGMQNWAVQPPADASVLIVIPNPAAAAAQGVTLASFRAAGTGTTNLTATDRPACAPGQACPQFIRAWRATITVDA